MDAFATGATDGIAIIWNIATMLIAALAVIGGTELFREFAEYRMLIFGLAMVLIMVFRPRGLIAHREPSVRLHSARQAPVHRKGLA